MSSKSAGAPPKYAVMLYEKTFEGKKIFQSSGRCFRRPNKPQSRIVDFQDDSLYQ